MGGPYIPIKVVVEIEGQPNQKVDTYTAAFPIEIAVRAKVISDLDHFPNINQEAGFVQHWDCYVDNKLTHPMRKLVLSSRSVIRFVPATNEAIDGSGTTEVEVLVIEIPGGKPQTLKVPATITPLELARKAGLIIGESEKDIVKFVRAKDCRMNGKEVHPYRRLNLSAERVETIVFTNAIR